MTDADLWTIARAGYEASPSRAKQAWDAAPSTVRYCWYLGAKHVVSPEGSLKTLRHHIHPGLDLTPWHKLNAIQVQQYRNVYGAMLSTAKRITARNRVAA